MRALVIACGLCSLAGGLVAQAEGLELLLRDGSVLQVRELLGDPKAGFDVEIAGGKRHVGAGELLAVLGTAAVVPAVPAAHLAGGDVLRGAIAGGDAGGNRVDLLSPVFGLVPIAVDRLAALAAPGVAAPLQLRLPDAVGEALFVRANVGFDVLAGSLHQFGEAGVRFQVQGSEAPRWFRCEDFVALRLREAVARDDAPPATLLTRVGDRVGVTPTRWLREGMACTLEGGTAVTVRPTDVAALCFLHDAAFLSDLTPVAVEESGYDGDVVHPFRCDHNALGGPLVTAGRSHGKGLGVHSRSRLSFRVPAGSERFWTRVGFDDSAATLGLEPRADVRVLVNGKVVFERKDLAAGGAVQDTGLVAVRPGDTVALEVDPGRGRDLGDRINWLGAVFLPPPARRP